MKGSPTLVVNLKLSSYDQYIGRAGHGEDGYFGNHHNIGNCAQCGEYHTRDGAIQAFKIDFAKRIAEDEVFRSRVLALKGKRLGCFCKPFPCHGDIYVEWIGQYG